MSSHHSNLGQESWPLEPPGPAEYEYLKRFVFAKVQEWKAKISQDDNYNGTSEDVEQQRTGNLAKEETAHQRHLAQAYHNWQILNEDKKQEQWRLECQKAYAEEYDRHQDTRERLDQLEQEIYHLRDRLNQQQNGQSALPTNLEVSSMPLSRSTMNSITAQEALNLEDWDYDRLLHKWKQRIRQDRSIQHPLPTAATLSPQNRPANGASSSHAPLAFDGTLDDQQQSYHEDDGDHEIEDEDLADAPGEDEDEDMVSAVQQQRNVLDPNLRGGGGNMDDGGRMLMELKGFQGVNGNGAASS